MLKTTVNIVDYNGVKRSEDLYFHLNKAEMIEMELTMEGGFQETVQRVISSEDNGRIFLFFKELVLKSYGVRTSDGRFVKVRDGHHLSEDFEQSKAYEEFLMSLLIGDNAEERAAWFVNGIVPSDMDATPTSEPVNQEVVVNITDH